MSLVLGVRRSPRNPNLCNRCSAHLKDGLVAEITAVFADLSGFTRLTRELGPERTSAIVDAFLRAASQAIHRHDGMVDKFLGDAVLAVFGAPIRRPDHARRAVAAAVDIQLMMDALSARFGVTLGARVGVSSGTVRLGHVGGDDAASFTAIGDAVNRASRLEGAAAVGEIAVDAEILQAVAAAFPEARAEPLELKGFDEPVAAGRLRATAATAAALRPADDAQAVRRVGRWAAVLAALGAPCAGFYLFSPLIVALGYGAVFQNATFLLVDGFLDDGPARIVLSSLSIAAALACLGLVVRVRLRRRRQGNVAARGERRQERKLLALAAIALALVAWEHWVHLALYGKSFWHMR
nr:adenylate/guanylate cyclase domain-containing protein [Nannocystis sp. SCPEA4]